MLQATPPRPKPTWRDIALGVVNANVLAALLMSLALKIPLSHPIGGYYATAATVIIPLLMGFLSGATWRKLNLSVGRTALFSLLTTAVGIACAFFFIKEGAVCLVMASPLLFLLIWGGTMVGIAVCRPGGNRPAAVSAVPVMLALLVYDASKPRTDDTRVVTTSVIVRATADRVYPHLVAFAPITKPPTFFLHDVGLPYPIQTVADGAYVGAWRECRFNDGIRIGERITAIEPGRRVAFDVTSQPRYPEYTEHGQLLRGEMSAVDNGDGTSTLSGTSWYTLRVHPFWYFGMWADEVIHAIHGRVFAHIAELSEADAKTALLAPLPPKHQ